MRLPTRSLLFAAALAMLALAVFSLAPDAYAQAPPSASSTDDTCSGGGYDPTPTAVTVDAVPIVVGSTTAEYFVLYVRHDVDGTEVELPVSVKRGETGTTALSENVAALPAERYRVEKYLVADPADVDGDCIDDITELDNLGRMNPVNSAAAIELTDGVVSVPDLDTLDSIRMAHGYVKFVLFGTDTDRPGVYFGNTKTHSSHASLLEAVGLDDANVITGSLMYDTGIVAPDGSRGIYYFEQSSVYSLGFMDYIYGLLAASMPVLDDDLALHLSNGAIRHLQDVLPSYRASRINLVFDQDIYGQASFLPLNPGVGYGRLRVMDLDERPNPREIVLYEALPNELPRVAGIVTTVPQTPLSHVNLRAVQDGIPNAFIREALDESSIAALLDGYVRYEVTEIGWELRAATRAEVDAHYASSRPAKKQTPQRDLSVTEIKPLSQIAFDDWNAFGVKAANVAVLRSFGFPDGTVPDGFAVPFYFYDEFMKANDFYDDIEEMLDDTDFQTDFEVQESELKKLRKAIKKGETPQWIIDALTDMHAEFPESQSLRYRSSTNNEDLPGFNGAGLYDSKTQKPDETEEDGIDKSLKQVYASLWNFRAFTERDFHRIDHLAAAMGVLVHPNYSDELVNGVAVSFDPVHGSTERYYVNSQVGEDLVTNPDAHSVPEEVLLFDFDFYRVIRTSNQVPPGQLLMTRAQLDQLRRHLTVIRDRFKELYKPASGEDFAMEIEFKITSDNVLAIKQARPWVFSPASASDGAGTVTDSATLSGLTLSGIYIGTFGPANTDYTADVDNDVTETTVTATANDGGASYVIKLGGVEDADGVIPLAVGANVITIEVTAGDGSATKTYTVTVTRAEASAQALSDDATLGALTLSGVNIGTFGPATTDYIADVDNDVTETTVTPTVNGGGATYVIKLDGVEDADGVIPLAVGSNVITIEVTAGDGSATKTYTVTVTRAEASAQALSDDATLGALTLSGVNIGTFDPAATEYTADVDNDVTETTVTPTVNGGGATYVIKLDGVEDADGVIPLAVGSNVITIEVTAEDGQTTSTYTATVTRAAPPLIAEFQEAPATHDGTAPFTFRIAFSEAISVSFVTIRDHALEVTGGSVTGAWREQRRSDLWGVRVQPDSNAAVTIALPADRACGTQGAVCTADGKTLSNRPEMTVPGPAPANNPVNSPATGALAISGATQVGQTLTASTSGIVDGDGLSNASFSFQWIVNDGSADTDIPGATGATYTLAAADEGKTVKVRVSFTDDGGNAESLTSAATGAVAAPPSPDATLSGLTLSGVNIGAFDAATTDYTASVGNDVRETTVTATANDGGATYVIKLGGVADADGVIPLTVGANAITIEVTAEDGQTTNIYTVTVTRAGSALTAEFQEAPATHDGTDPFTFRIAFSEAISTSYVVVRDHALEVTGGTVAAAGRVDGRNDLWWVRVQPDSDADVSIALPANRACDTQGAVCTTDEKALSNRLELTVPGPQPTLSSDATLSGLALSSVDVGTFDSATTQYTASVANSVTETDGNAHGERRRRGLRGQARRRCRQRRDRPPGGGKQRHQRRGHRRGRGNYQDLHRHRDQGRSPTARFQRRHAERPGPERREHRRVLRRHHPLHRQRRQRRDRDHGDGDRQRRRRDLRGQAGRRGQIADGTVALAEGSNAITVEVTAEDGQTTKTYTVTVTRAEAPPSDDATLSGLTLSGVNIGAFDSATTEYTASVGNDVDRDHGDGDRQRRRRDLRDQAGRRGRRRRDGGPGRGKQRRQRRGHRRGREHHQDLHRHRDPRRAHRVVRVGHGHAKPAVGAILYRNRYNHRVDRLRRLRRSVLCGGIR